MSKVDQKGTYLRFPGTTVICDIVDTKAWSEFHKVLMSKTNWRKYFSPLPFESFHVTIKGINTSVRDFAGERTFFDDILTNFQRFDLIRGL
jgi:hypothetical protein